MHTIFQNNRPNRDQMKTRMVFNEEKDFVRNSDYYTEQTIGKGWNREEYELNKRRVKWLFWGMLSVLAGLILVLVIYSQLI